MAERCPNPKCTCVECTCGVTCRCGVTWMGPLERQVMEVLWSRVDQEMSAREVADHFPESAYTTIATVLERLVGKDLLRRRDERRVIMYTATGTRAVHTAQLMLEILNSTRDPEAALASFAQLIPDDQVLSLRASLRGASDGLEEEST